MAQDSFPETSWTLLARAREHSIDGICAREDFAQRYYRPVQAFLRILVRDPSEVQDLSQEFFAKVIEPGGLLEHINRKKGRFRDFLRASLRHLAIDHMRRKSRHPFQSYPNHVNGEECEMIGGAELNTAEAAFHRAWVEDILMEALARVRAVCIKREQEVHLALFEGRHLSDIEPKPSWRELGVPHGLDEKTARERADTVVHHFRSMLRSMLRDEISAPPGIRLPEAAIDDEIRALLSPFND